MLNHIMLAAGGNPILPIYVLIGVVIVGLGILLRYFKQPFIIAYILAGILLGKHGYAVITDEGLIQTLGELGLILLLFFIGMEISLHHFIEKWKVSIFGTLSQIIASILFVGLIGYFFQWSINRIILIGFVISLSSSAVIIKLLEDNKEMDTLTGRNVISILLMQDILIVPMLIASTYLGGDQPSTSEVILQLTGGLLLIFGMVYIFKTKEIDLPLSEAVKKDHEFQVFLALIVCFGFAALTAFFGLSAALGAFFGGMFIHSAKSTEWIHDSLHSFRVIFVALFFLSIGMLIDLEFIYENWNVIGLLILAVYITNHFINTIILQYFGRNWHDSMYGGALLAQIGELGFVLISSAFYSNIISPFEYQLTIVVISLTLLISPFWISLTKKIIGSTPVT